MRTITAAKKSAPKFIDDTHVQVTREFAKNARIFGTPEYKLWKEIRKDCPKAEMVLKTIKTKQNKIIETKNMTYENMAAYIREQTNAKDLMSELKLHIEKSKVQTSPYHYVLAWFMQKFKGYDSYKIFFAEEAKKQAQKNDIFTVVKSAATVVDKATADEEKSEYDLVSGM